MTYLSQEDKTLLAKTLKERKVLERKRLALLFVCLGNICRSPAAEAICYKTYKDKFAEAWLPIELKFDSAGTSGYHHGEKADPRTRASCDLAGYSVTSLSRKIYPDHDFKEFDLIFTMDDSNYRDVLKMSHPKELEGRLWPLVKFSKHAAFACVPDPYLMGEQGFRDVISICEKSCLGLLETMNELLSVK